MLDRLWTRVSRMCSRCAAIRRKGQTTFVATEGGFRYASELTSFIRENYRRQVLHRRRGLPGEAHRVRQSGGRPHEPEAQSRYGASFLVTQLFFDNRRYFEFVDNARAHGITVPIIPGIMPITNAAQVERFTLLCGASLPFRLAAELDRRRDNPQAVMQLGIAHATAQCIELLQGGAPGIHFYTLNRSTATMQVLTALRTSGMATPVTLRVFEPSYL